MAPAQLRMDLLLLELEVPLEHMEEWADEN
jgi:hypothetical protein